MLATILLSLCAAPLSTGSSLAMPTCASHLPQRPDGHTPAPRSVEAQGPDAPLAHYTQGKRRRTITRTDVALEMANHQQRLERGKEAVGMLVDALLTRRAAERAGAMPGDDEVRAFWRRLQDQMLAAGHRPEEFAAVRNSGEQQWLQDLGLQLAQERMVRRELGLGADEQVSADMMKLWIQAQHKRASIETDPDRLPLGVAARVDDESVPLIDLGMLLLRTSEDDERDRFARQIAYLECLEDRAATAGVAVTPTDLDAAIERQRADASQEPRYRGVSFAEILQSQGLTIEALRARRTFRAQILLEKLTALEHPRSELLQRLSDHRDEVLQHHGPRRRIGVIWLRAQEEPNTLVPRDFPAAEQQMAKIRQRIAKDGFAATASIESEHGPSKQVGGDVGWHHATSDQLPKPVLDAAFALRPQEVSPAVRLDDGVALVTVLGVEAMPTDEELLLRMQKSLAGEVRDAILAAAMVHIGTTDQNPTESGK